MLSVSALPIHRFRWRGRILGFRDRMYEYTTAGCQENSSNKVPSHVHRACKECGATEWRNMINKNRNLNQSFTASLSTTLERIYMFRNRWCPTCLNAIRACTNGMHIYLIVAHAPYHFKIPIPCVQQGNILSVAPVAIPWVLFLRTFEHCIVQ